MNFNFLINAKTFADALSQELRIIPNKSSVLILENFKLTLTQPTTCEGVAQLAITATSPDSTVTIALQPTTAEGEGAVCINARKLTETIKKLDGEVHVSVNETEIMLNTKTGRYQLQGLNAEEYPQTENIADASLSVEVDTESLISGLGATLYAVGQDDYRPVMKGVYFDFASADGKVVFVATDTHKLAKCEKPLTELTQADKSEDTERATLGGYILPFAAATAIASFFAKEPSVRVRFSTRQAEFCNGNVRYTTALLNGRYPDWKRVLRTDLPIHVKVDRNALRNAINRVYGFSSENTMIALCFDNLGELQVVAKDNNTMQNASETLTYDGQTDLRIGFSAEYLLQILGSLAGERIEIGLADASRAATFTDGGDAIALLMPMSLN